jgi:hypothetical protein
MVPELDALPAGLATATKSEQDTSTTTSKDASTEPIITSTNHSLAIDTDISLARSLLEEYSHLPPAQIDSHIQAIVSIPTSQRNYN